MAKVFAKPIECTYFLYRGPRDQWYPRSIANSLVDEYTERWDDKGVEYKEVTKQEMVSQGAQLDLGKDLSDDDE